MGVCERLGPAVLIYQVENGRHGEARCGQLSLQRLATDDRVEHLAVLILLPPNVFIVGTEGQSVK